MAAVRRPLLLAALTCLALSASALQVAVTGATGRVGRLVVQRLLDDGHGVTAVVRDTAKAAEVLPPAAAAAAATCDLATCDTDGLSAACAGADALIWYARPLGRMTRVRGPRPPVPNTTILPPSV